MGRSPKILLSVGVVALGPLMFFINVWAKASFIGVDHELVQIHGLLGLVQILGEFSIRHQVSHRGAFLGTERQRVNFLLLFV